MLKRLRMNIIRPALLALAAGAIALPVAAAAKTPAGVWANPANSVHVTFVSCGKAICGRIVWANEKAKADALAGSGEPLVDSFLFRDFRPDGDHRWAGKVRVPDIGQTLSGTIEQIDAKTLRGEGCLIAGLGCKEQTWRRIR